MAAVNKKALALSKSYAAGLDTANDAVDALKADLLDLAPAYSAAATYALGAFCTYSGNLYECTSAIAVPEAWTAGHWTVRTTGYVLASLTSQLAAITPLVVENDTSSPALGTLANNTEYRCTDTTLTTAPTMTLGTIAAATTQFAAAVVFVAPDTNAPVVTNSSGKTLKYKGDGVAAGTFTPTPATTYRLSYLWDGVYLTCYVSGVA